tara:strand:+ start:6976 stop:7335 length:360 start_codon:yes stop_codon:yes gene_type:complete
MSIKKIIFLLSIITFSCKEIVENRSPDDLIPPEQMSKVMADIILMKNIKRESSYIKNKKNLLVPEYLYEKYEIDSLKLAVSQSYYAKNPKKYIPVFKMVEIRLKMLRDSIEKTLRAVEE